MEKLNIHTFNSFDIYLVQRYIFSKSLLVRVNEQGTCLVIDRFLFLQVNDNGFLLIYNPSTKVNLAYMVSVLNNAGYGISFMENHVFVTMNSARFRLDTSDMSGDVEKWGNDSIFLLLTKIANLAKKYGYLEE